jgi:hypothetical protein
MLESVGLEVHIKSMGDIDEVEIDGKILVPGLRAHAGQMLNGAAQQVGCYSAHYSVDSAESVQASDSAI